MEQKKLCVRGTDWYCNIIVTRIERDDSIVYAYNGEELVGIFDIGGFLAMWTSTPNKQEGSG